MTYAEIITARRAFTLPGYWTLADDGLDGDYVCPPQITSCSPDGPVLLAYHWLDAETARRERAQLLTCGFLRGMIFNTVVDDALAAAGFTRGSVYITQAFHLLSTRPSQQIPGKEVDASLDAITRHELEHRSVIALGGAAQRVCRRHGIKTHSVPHPSARRGSLAARAHELSVTLLAAGLTSG